MFQGSIVALVTPFHQNLSIDFAALEALIEWHIEEGTDAISLCGTTGENGTLSYQEFLAIIEKAVKVARGRVPIIAGTGCLDTCLTVKKTIESRKLGADGALVVLPYYSRPTEEGCLAHFQEVAKAGLPMIIYHHPGRCGIRLSPATLAKISEIPGVVNIKDAVGELSHTLELMNQTKTPLLCGDDTLALPHLACGTAGVISIVANLIPRKWKEFIVTLRNGELEEGRKMFQEFYSLCHSLVIETNPQGVKFALSKMGKCKPYLRLPLVMPRASTQLQIETELNKLPALLDQFCDEACPSSLVRSS